MNTLDYAIAYPVEFDRELLPVGDGEYEAHVSHHGHAITIWRFDRDCDSQYGREGADTQNNEALDSLEECLEDCRESLARM